jgi:glutamine synthetase type III
VDEGTLQVAEAAIQLGEMEKQAALAAKQEAEMRLEAERNAHAAKVADLEAKYKHAMAELEKAEEVADEEEETIPALEAKLKMLKQMEEEEAERNAAREVEVRGSSRPFPWCRSAACIPDCV